MAQASILVVADRADLVNGLQDDLTALGYEVLAVLDCDVEAVRAVADLRPDLVIMDIILTGKPGGVEAVARKGTDHRIPLLYVAAHPDEVALLPASELEPHACLLKPFQEQELGSAVERLLRKHQLDQELCASAERFRLYYDRAPLACLFLDGEGRLIEVNPAWLEMLGYSRHEVIGRPLADLVSPQQRDRLREICLQPGNDGEPPTGSEFELLCKDRSLVPVLVEVRVDHDLGGSASQRTCILHDMTERMRAEDTLRQRNRELALLNRAARVINSTLELDQVLAAVLTEARRLLEITACSVWLVDPDSEELVCRQATDPNGNILRGWRLAPGEGLGGWTVRTGQSMVVADAKLDERHFSGVDRQTGLTSRSILSVPLQTAGQVIGVLQVMDERADRFGPTDLTLIESLAALAVTAIQNAQLFGQAQREIAERREAEEAIKLHAVRLALLNQIGDKIAAALDLDQVLDRSARLVQGTFGYQHVALYMLDLERGELVMRSKAGDFAHLFPPDHRLRLGQGMVGWVGRHNETLLANDIADEPRHLNFFPDLLPTRAALCVPIRAGAEVVGVIDVQSVKPNAFDASDVLVMETLAGQIGVAVENIRLSGDAAEVEILRELDVLRSELIANVSHEVRTPLGLIKIFCTTLLREDMVLDPATRREFLLDIDDETSKLEQIVDNLLDLSRIGAGRLRLDRQPTDLGQLAGRVMEAMRVQIQGHRLFYDFPAEPIIAAVDPERIDQVLRNLLTNAIKYSPDGGEIAIHGRGDAKHMALIWVSDQGIGIPVEDLQRVFERFYRVENEATERVRGAGLGLAVCKSLVEAHGGHIWAESTPGEGSAIYLTLPVDGGHDLTER